MRKIRLLSLLLVAALLLQNADAALTYLPYSSYYQGRSYFDDSDTGVKGRVEFAVYDTGGAYGNEWANATGFDVPGGNDRYIYAYQIFNDTGSTAIERFTMWADDGHVLNVNNMGNQDPRDLDNPFIPLCVESNAWGDNGSGEQIWWEFNGGTLVAGKDSWFLIFRSSGKRTSGAYAMEPVNNIIPIPNPEPCTLALLGLGGAMVFRKRRNSVKSC
ncbi:MAG: PEP-CTERM sorting domain-containing protein [Phycisphaerae bacterium]|nr:PEP-CTERM sorting domain-containing protein [Phycisphaerae bacterium]